MLGPVLPHSICEVLNVGLPFSKSFGLLFCFTVQSSEVKVDNSIHVAVAVVVGQTLSLEWPTIAWRQDNYSLTTISNPKLALTALKPGCRPSVTNLL